MHIVLCALANDKSNKNLLVRTPGTFAQNTHIKYYTMCVSAAKYWIEIIISTLHRLTVQILYREWAVLVYDTSI